MKWTRYIVRGVLLLLTACILMYLHLRTRENIELISDFKFETLDNIKADSLDKKYKFDILENETRMFSGKILEDTSHVKEAVHYLIGLIGLFIVVELSFFILKGKAADK